MENSKRTIAIVCGGDSSEHDVSLRSGQGLYSFFDKERYDIYLVDVKGTDWHVALDNGETIEIDKNDFSFVKDGKHVCAFNNITRIGSTIYLGTMDQGIISFDTRSGEFEHFVEVGCNIISSLSSDGKNMLYVGTDGNGVHFIATDRRKVVRTMRHETGDNESLRSNSVYSLLVDRNGMIWIGFYQLGLDYTLYQSDLFTTYAFPPYALI